MIRQKNKRILQTVITVIVIMLLQIFNGVDWHCIICHHHRQCDTACKMEHRTEITCLQDETSLYTPDIIVDATDTMVFLQLSPTNRRSMYINIGKHLNALTPITSIPHEELVPLRC